MSTYSMYKLIPTAVVFLNTFYITQFIAQQTEQFLKHSKLPYPSGSILINI